MLDMYQHNGTALAAHRVRPYDGRVVVFRAERGRPGPVTQAPDLGWGPLAREVVLHEVPGDHYLMMEPAQVGALARLVAGYLREGRPAVASPVQVEAGAAQPVTGPQAASSGTITSLTGVAMP
jgi:thioesterase domain-containing protein